MFKRTLMSLAIGLGLALPGLAMVPSAGAVNLFPSNVCKSQSNLNQSTTVCKQNSTEAGSQENPIIRALRVVITVLSVIVGISSVIVIMVSGIRMITSNGDSQSFGRARNSIIYALIALAITASAATIVSFVLSKL